MLKSQLSLWQLTINMIFLKRIQSPKTDFGKAFRFGIISAFAVGAVAFLQSLDAVDFGVYDNLVTVVFGIVIESLNRMTR